MATAIATAAITNKLKTGNVLRVYGTITFDSGDYATGGLDVSGISTLLPTRRAAYFKHFYSALGYHFEWDKANDKILIRQDNGTATAAPLPELSAAALPTLLAGATINFVAEYPQFG